MISALFASISYPISVYHSQSERGGCLKMLLWIFFGPQNFMGYFLRCNCAEFFYGEDILSDLDHLYIHVVKFSETIIESCLQMMLSSYIIHHHGWNKATFSSIDGDIQICSLIGSTLSILLNMATRHAWFELGRKPGFSEILKYLLFSTCSMVCYLLTTFIFLANSYIVLLIHFGCSLVWVVITHYVRCLLHIDNNLSAMKIFTLDRMLVMVTLFMAILHTVQLYVIGINNLDFNSKSFNNCQNHHNVTAPNGNFTQTDSEVEDLDVSFNLIHSHSLESLILMWTLTSVSFIFIVCDWKFFPKRKQVSYIDFLFSLHLHLKENHVNEMELEDMNGVQNQLLNGQDQNT